VTFPKSCRTSSSNPEFGRLEFVEVDFVESQLLNLNSS